MRSDVHIGILVLLLFFYFTLNTFMCDVPCDVFPKIYSILIFWISYTNTSIVWAPCRCEYKKWNISSCFTFLFLFLSVSLLFSSQNVYIFSIIFPWTHTQNGLHTTRKIIWKIWQDICWNGNWRIFIRNIFGLAKCISYEIFQLSFLPPRHICYFHDEKGFRKQKEAEKKI